MYGNTAEKMDCETSNGVVLVDAEVAHFSGPHKSHRSSQLSGPHKYGRITMYDISASTQQKLCENRSVYHRHQDIVFA